MANSVGSQMSTATTALLDADVALADLVIAGDKQIDATRESIDQRCFTLLARQQPVATDLRTIVTATRIASRSEEHTSELQSRRDLVCRLLLEKKNKKNGSSPSRYSGVSRSRDTPSCPPRRAP